jgi:hypothetical protein
MLRFIFNLVTAVRVFFLCRTDLALEILALRQQVAVLKRRCPRQAEPDGQAVLERVTQCRVPLGRGAAGREAGDSGGFLQNLTKSSPRLWGAILATRFFSGEG